MHTYCRSSSWDEEPFKILWDERPVRNRVEIIFLNTPQALTQSEQALSSAQHEIQDLKLTLIEHETEVERLKALNSKAGKEMQKLMSDYKDAKVDESPNLVLENGRLIEEIKR